MLMRIDDLRQTLLNIDEEVYLLHGALAAALWRNDGCFRAV